MQTRESSSTGWIERSSENAREAPTRRPTSDWRSVNRPPPEAAQVEGDWDTRRAQMYWRELADVSPDTCSPELRFDLRRTLEQIRAAFGVRSR